MLLKVTDVRQNGIIHVLQSEFLILLQIDTSLEQDLLLLVEVFHDISEFIQAGSEPLSTLANGSTLPLLTVL